MNCLGFTPGSRLMAPALVENRLMAIFSTGGRPYVRPPVSQGPDLNRSVADLQSAAWPLRHLGSAVL